LDESKLDFKPAEKENTQNKNETNFKKADKKANKEIDVEKSSNEIAKMVKGISDGSIKIDK
jgi:hypothetical protein